MVMGWRLFLIASGKAPAQEGENGPDAQHQQHDAEPVLDRSGQSLKIRGTGEVVK
jgi:hypothetical protein